MHGDADNADDYEVVWHVKYCSSFIADVQCFVFLYIIFLEPDL